MPAEHSAVLLLLTLAAGGAQAATPDSGTAAAKSALKPVSATAADAELLEFLDEFSADDGGFVDPFALDKVGKALEKEISKLDAAAAKTPAPVAAKEKDNEGK